MVTRDEETGEVKEKPEEEEEDNLMDLISGYKTGTNEEGGAEGLRGEKRGSGSGKSEKR